MDFIGGTMNIFLLVVLFPMVLVNPANSQSYASKENDTGLLININNLKMFYEFHSNMGFVGKVREGKVDKVVQGDNITYKWCSPVFDQKYKLKIERRKSILAKYENMFSLDRYGIVNMSFDRKLIAYTSCCDGKKTLYVMNIQDKQILFTIKPFNGIYIDDVEWVNDSIGIISRDSRMGYWPWELLATLAGHPIPHNSFFLEFYSSEGKLMTSTSILKNITYGWGTLIKN
jgi:hypothetical protein